MRDQLRTEQPARYGPMIPFLNAGTLGVGVIVLLMSVAASPLSSWWVANAIANFRLQLAAFALVVLVLGLLLRNPLVVLIGAGSIVINGLIVLDRLQPAPGAAGPLAAGPVLRAMSLNLSYTNRDAQAVFGQIHSTQPDVLLLQEVGIFWVEALRELRASFPYGLQLPHADSSARGHGALVLSRYPILEAEQRTLGGASIRLAAARLAVGNHAPWVASVHAAKPIGRASLALQRRQLQQLAAWVNARDAPVLLGGDFNATSYAPQVRRLLAVTGLVLDQQASPSQAFASTFPSPLRMLGLKIDHILVRGMTIRRAWTLPPAGSDHRSVVADVSLAGR